MPLDYQALLAQLRTDEGLRLSPYLDSVGVWTCAYGHNLTARPISLAVAEMLLKDDVDAVLGSLAALPWFAGLSDVRQRVIANMAFNLGVGGLHSFHDMIAALERQDFDRAADELLASRWANQVGARAPRLARMMRTGKAA